MCKLINPLVSAAVEQSLGRERACLAVVLQSEGFGGRPWQKQKIAVVTGSSSGIGLLTAVELARERLSRGGHHARSGTQRPAGRSGAESRRARSAGPAAGRHHRDRFPSRRGGGDRPRSRPHRPAGEQCRIQHRRFCRRHAAARAPPSDGNQLLRQRRDDQGRAAGNAQAALRPHRSDHLGRRTRGRSHAEQLLPPRNLRWKVGARRCASRVHSLGIRVVLVEPGSYDTDIWERNLVIGKQRSIPARPTKNAANALPSS